AEDLTQEAFFRAYLGLDSFRYEAKFSTWLTRIAINVVLHHFERKRAQKRTARVFSIDAARDRPGSPGQTEIPDRTYLPDEWAVRNERQVAIVEAVAELPEDFRSALALRELQQLSYQEIAESLGLPIGTVKSKIFRARAILQEKLKGIL
ncbi:MAG: sigma-70 family RNA polymerase sigma factor, partial [Planctomycetota bacterium]